MTDTTTHERPRILFIDDEPRVLVALKALFRQQYDVLIAEGGAAAVEALRNQDVDVVVSDQRMPGMTGIEVLRAARELRPRAMRLLLTGYSDLNAIIGSINEGEIFRFISKPWLNDDLRTIIAEAIEASRTAPPQVEAAAPAATPAPQRPKSELGVLILDPDADTRTALSRTLGADYPMHFAANVEECVGLLERHRIGVIVTEAVVDGYPVTGLLNVLKRYQPHLVSVVITAQADAEQAIDMINRGQVYRLLKKPLGESVCRASVNLAMRRFDTLLHHPELVRRHRVEEKPVPALEKSGLLERIRRLVRPQENAAR